MKQLLLKLLRRTFEDGYSRTVRELMLEHKPIGEALGDLKKNPSKRRSQYHFGRITAAQQLKDLHIKSLQRGIRIQK